MVKDICKKCFGETMGGWYHMDEDRWTPFADKYWARGEMYLCPVGNCGSRGLGVKTETVWWVGSAENVNPPKGCNFELEHLVLGQ